MSLALLKEERLFLEDQNARLVKVLQEAEERHKNANNDFESVKQLIQNNLEPELEGLEYERNELSQKANISEQEHIKLMNELTRIEQEKMDLAVEQQLLNDVVKLEEEERGVRLVVEEDERQHIMQSKILDSLKEDKSSAQNMLSNEEEKVSILQGNIERSECELSLFLSSSNEQSEIRKRSSQAVHEQVDKAQRDTLKLSNETQIAEKKVNESHSRLEHAISALAVLKEKSLKVKESKEAEKQILAKMRSESKIAQQIAEEYISELNLIRDKITVATDNYQVICTEEQTVSRKLIAVEYNLQKLEKEFTDRMTTKNKYHEKLEEYQNETANYLQKDTDTVKELNETKKQLETLQGELQKMEINRVNAEQLRAQADATLTSLKCEHTHLQQTMLTAIDLRSSAMSEIDQLKIVIDQIKNAFKESNSRSVVSKNKILQYRADINVINEQIKATNNRSTEIMNKIEQLLQNSWSQLDHPTVPLIKVSQCDRESVYNKALIENLNLIEPLILIGDEIPNFFEVENYHIVKNEEYIPETYVNLAYSVSKKLQEINNFLVFIYKSDEPATTRFKKLIHCICGLLAEIMLLRVIARESIMPILDAKSRCESISDAVKKIVSETTLATKNLDTIQTSTLQRSLGPNILVAQSLGLQDRHFKLLKQQFMAQTFTQWRPPLIIDLRKNCLTGEFANDLMYMIENYPFICKIDFRENQISEKDIKKIVSSIQKIKGITSCNAIPSELDVVIAAFSGNIKRVEFIFTDHFAK